MNSSLRFAQEVGEGVYAIDTAFVRDEFDSCYLVTQKTTEGIIAAFIDVGTSVGAPRLVATLEDLGISIEDVRYIIPTHVHLDHAGGAGEMMRRCPNASLIIHPRGTRHMIDPTALVASATAIYGEEVMRREYGEIVPVSKERVIEASDYFEIDLGSRKLLCLDTPGHAKHHVCIWDELTRGFFTGDTFGISYREFDTADGAFVIPSTTPTQFEPEVLRETLAKMMSFEPQVIYFTHYGAGRNVEGIHTQLKDQLVQMESLGRKYQYAPDRHQRLMEGLSEIYVNAAKKHGLDMSSDRVIQLLELDIELNAKGMACWLDR